ncbi:MAG: substrate-binding domain-containing protein, partial [Armatimonadota bacterium]
IPQRIYEDLAGKISRGDIAYMEQLPVLPELCELYATSQMTVRRALEELERNGFIRRQRGRGKGTFAIKKNFQASIRLLFVNHQEVLRSPIEYHHEAFDLIAGVREAAAGENVAVHNVVPSTFDSISAPSTETGAVSVGYIIIAMDWISYIEGVRLANQHQAPFVLLNAPNPGFPCVRVDMEEAAFLAVQHLAQSGHQRIAYVGCKTGEWFSPRWEGYRRALAECGLAYDADLFYYTDGVDPKMEEAALNHLLGLSEPPTAIFTSSDYCAFNLMNHCRKLGISIPEDLSLCGYDNIAGAADVIPSLTTVHHARLEQGKEAVSLLLDLMYSGKSEKTDRLIKPYVVERESTAPPKVILNH